MPPCTFCKIVSRELSSNVLFEDDFVVVILDIDPISEGLEFDYSEKTYSGFWRIGGGDLA